MKKNTILEPNDVIKNVIVPAIKESNTGFKLLNSNIFPPIDKIFFFFDIVNVNSLYLNIFDVLKKHKKNDIFIVGVWLS